MLSKSGVRFDEASGQWQARRIVGGKYLHIGLFDTPEAARAASRAASNKGENDERRKIKTHGRVL